MDTYIGVKKVEAGLIRPTDLNTTIVYPDGYQSQCPNGTFNAANFKIVGADNKVHPEDVKAMVARVHSETIKMAEGQLITLVTVTLVNGFTITESSACVDPANYDEQIGRDICYKKVEDKIWFLLGFLMQTAVYGFNKVAKD